MSLYSNYTYCLEEESTHFGLRVSTHFEVFGQFVIENHKRKTGNIHRDFLNYTTFHA